MPRLSRLQRSNNAHFDLRVKAGNLPGKRGDVVYVEPATISLAEALASFTNTTNGISVSSGSFFVK